MKIDQNYMEEEVIKPIEKRLKELEATMWTVKNDVAKLTREIIKKEVKKEKEVK